jgi:hypothetical protein
MLSYFLIDTYFFIAIVLSHFSLIQYSVILYCYTIHPFLITTMLSNFLLLQCSVIHLLD